MRRALAAAALALAAWAAPARLAAQQPAQLIDRIAAVVGDRTILLSEIDEEINQRRSQGLQVPEDSLALQALRRQVLNDLIDDEVVYQRARRDTTVQVTDAEVQSGVEEQYRQVRSQFRTESEFRAALQQGGWTTPEEYRRWFADQQRRFEYRRRFIEKQRQEGKLRPGAVSEADLRRAFDEARRNPQMRKRPPSIAFEQVVVVPHPSDSARAAALVRAESALAELNRGADFATLARRLSEDPSTKEQGGDLGWFRRGMMVRQFEDVAFRLRPGQVSPIVHTLFGYHVIQVERIQPAEIKARHILFAPAVSDSDLAVARRTADSVAALLRAGWSPDSLAQLYGDTAEPSTVGPLDRSQLMPAYTAAFQDAPIGPVLEPFAVDPDNPLRTRYVVARVTDVQPERDFAFDEVREQLRLSVAQDRAYRDFVARLRRQTYVDVRLP